MLSSLKQLLQLIQTQHQAQFGIIRIMKKLKLVILLFVLAAQASAQDVLHLCVGPNHNFGVPYTNGSAYYWQVQADTTIATIISGNGTEHIIIDINNTGVVQ